MMEKNKNGGTPMKNYFENPEQNEAFNNCIRIMSEMIEKYGYKVRETGSAGDTRLKEYCKQLNNIPAA